MRLSSETFSLNNINSFVHLTNHAVQQYSKSFGKYEDGNMVEFGTLLVAYIKLGFLKGER